MYDKIKEVLEAAWIDASDVSDLIRIFREDDPVVALNKINGDRICYLIWVLKLITDPDPKLKEQAQLLLQKLNDHYNSSL